MAQLVAQLICNHQVAGSSPAAGSIFFLHFFTFMENISVRNSYIRSWHSSCEDFAPFLGKLFSGVLENCPDIYHTKHKECRLVSREISGASYPVVVKRYFEKRFFRYLFRPSLAYREYCGFKLAADAGIPAARVVALGEVRSGVRLKEAFFITEYLEDYRNGHEFTLPGCDEKLKDEFIRINLLLLAKLHAAGLVHGGFHPRNELFRINSDGAMEVVWIDLATVMLIGRSRRFSPENDIERFLSEFALPAEKKAGYCDIYRNNL